jgi:predicted HTH transcriptional regulator
MDYKIQDPAQRRERIDKIEAWISKEAGPILIPEQAQAIIQEAHSRVVQVLDLEIKKLKQMRANKAFSRIGDESGSG